MAAIAPLNPGLDEAVVRALLTAVAPGDPLPVVHFQSPSEEVDDQWQSVAYLLRCRTSGFMLGLPATEKIRSSLEGWLDSDSDPVPFIHEVEVAVETTRGRAAGSAMVLLVDLPWSATSVLRRVSALRGAQAAALIKIMAAGKPVRPVGPALWEASERWIHEQEDEIFQDYQTAESGPEAPPRVTIAGVGGGEHQDIIRQLQDRIQFLEGQAAATHGGGRELFPPGPTSPTLDDAAWKQLQSLAGPAPGRLGKFERSPTRPAAKVQAAPLFTTQAEVAAEVVEEDELAQVEACADPMQKLLLLQMKQTSALLQRLAPKSHDPLSNALVGGSEAGSSTGGVKGCHAREIYVKQMDDLPAVARMIQKNVLQDLGLEQPYPGLMRDFVEKRMCLGDMKTLTLYAMFLASGWETAYHLRDENMMGWTAKGLMMTEQFCLDNGRTKVGWLLAGLPEPNFGVLERNKPKRGLRPYARTANPAWVAANVAYLKDIDFLETRLRDPKSSASQKDMEEKPDKTPRPTRKTKGGGKASDKSDATNQG